jgi:hypothetical protein
VLFEPRLREGLRDGSITLAFRRWRRVQVVAGHRYRTGLGMVLAIAVDEVTPSEITLAQARAAGYPEVAALLADVRGDTSLPLYRIRFRQLDEPDPRAALAATPAVTDAEAAAIGARLARMDRASPRGPWTAAIIAQIAQRPGVSSVQLAATMGWERPVFKAHVRRLKELGLTESLRIGYRLSPRGQAYLAAAPPPRARPGEREQG